MKRIRSLLGKQLAVITVFALVLSYLPARSAAAETSGGEGKELSSGEYTYVLCDDGTAELSRYKGEETVVHIPEKIDGHTVSIIGESCFEFSDVESVTIPVSVKEIEECAFNHCTKLTEVEISEMSETDDPALSDEVDALDSDSGTGTDWIVGSQLRSVGKAAFFSCTRLKDIVLPLNVEQIGEGAFYDCESMEKVECNGTIEDIGDYAFADCKKLKEFTLTGMKKIGRLMLMNCESLEDFCVPEDTEVIGRKAFKNCEKLNKIEIPDSVKEIEDEAFLGSGLRSVSFDCEKVGKKAFCQCNSLTGLDLGENIKTIEEEAFYNTNIGVVNIPDSIEDIASTAFASCKCRKFIVDENNEHYSSKDGVLFDDDMTELVRYPLAKKSDSYTIPDSVEKLDDYSFQWCQKLENIRFGKNVREIGKYCFQNVDNMAELVLPETVESIGEGAFFESTFSTITIPGSVKTILTDTFKDCSSLESLTLSEGVETIKSGAFKNLSLDKLKFPASVKTIENGFLQGSYTEVEISADNPYFTVDNDVLFNKDKTELIFCFAKKSKGSDMSEGEEPLGKEADDTVYEVPASVKKIRGLAFSNDNDLETLRIPKTVTELEPYSAGYKCDYAGIEKKYIVIEGESESAAADYAKENQLAFITGVPAQNAENISLKSGETFDFKVDHVLPDTISYFSDDKNIAVISETGRITGVAKGKTTVFALSGGQTFECSVEVTDGKEPADEWAKYRSIPIEDFTLWEDEFYQHNSHISTELSDNPAIYRYTGSDYIPIVAVQDPEHRYMQRTLESYGEDYKQYYNVSKNLSKELKKFEVQENIRVYSGQPDVSAFTGKKGADIKDMIGAIGKTSVSKTVFSTTLNHGTATNFSGIDGVVLEIYVPEGTSVGAYIPRISNFPNETEFLLDKELTFKVIDAGVRRIGVMEYGGIMERTTEKYMKLQIIADKNPHTSQKPPESSQPSASPGATNNPNATPKPSGSPGASPKPSPTGIAKGATVKKGNAVFKVTKKGKPENGKVTGATVSYQKPAASKKAVTIPASVKIKGVTYKVTAVSDKAFYKDKKLKSVVIGKNVRTIGRQAFYQCKKLNKIKILSKSCSSVGKKAFYGISKKAAFTVPKGRDKYYKKKLTKAAGIVKTMRIAVKCI